MDTWRTIVRRDSRMISNAIQRVACEPMLRAAFPGKPILATWKLETEPDAVPAEVFDLAAKAKSADLLLDPGEVSEQTGYTVTREEAPQLPMAGFGFNSAPVEPSARERVRAAIQGDIGPVADRVRELLAIEDPGEAREAAAKLAADIPGLMPDDPELADALEREIAEAFAEGARDGGTVENARGGNPDNRGQFSKAEGPHGESEAAKAKRENRERKKANKETGDRNFAIVRGGQDCRDFMRSKALGRIAFYQGNDAEGYIHIVKRAEEDKDHAAMLEESAIVDTLAFGKYYPDTYHGRTAWTVVSTSGNAVVLGEDVDGVKIITAYKLSASKQKVFSCKKAIENSEVDAP